MIDPKLLLNHFASTAQKLALKGVPKAEVEAAKDLLIQRNLLLSEVERLRHAQKTLSKKFVQSAAPSLKRPLNKPQEALDFKDSQTTGLKKKRKDLLPPVSAQDAKAFKEQSVRRKAMLSEKSEALERIKKRFRQSLLSLPNLPHSKAPLTPPPGAVIETNFRPQDFQNRTFHPHWEIAQRLDILDSKRAAKITGSMFSILKGQGARLLRALLDLAYRSYEKDYMEFVVPSLVNTAAFTGTGHLPKFSHDAYHIEKDDLWLIPTGEVPLTALHSNEILKAEDLPLKYMAHTPCFRREAGAAGQAGRGMQRLHEFHKLELVRICRPEDSERELEDLLKDALKPIQALQLPYRVLDLPPAELTFASARTYDIEVYSPGAGQWLEVSSVGLFTDYQTRRSRIRFREGAGNMRFPHALNGSGIAVPRVWAAVLELYEQKDGRIRTPDVLRDFMGRSYME